MIPPKENSICEEENLLEILENGTIMGAIEIDEENYNTTSDLSSVISLPSDIFNTSFNSHQENERNIEINNSEINSLIIVNNSNQVNNEINPEPSNNIPVQQIEMLNTSDACSHESRQSKRMRKKLLKHCRPTKVIATAFPPAYATIYLDTTEQTAVIQSSGNFNQMRTFDGGHLTLSVPVIRRPHTERVRKGCCFSWMARPSLPLVIGILALGGVACTLGGIVLGSTGLIEHSTQYLSAALLMIGIGVSLLVISGAIWRLSLPDDTDPCPCFRPTTEPCRNCNSPNCNNRIISGSLIQYPEFQHQTPPPSYLASSHECTVRLLLREPQNFQNENLNSTTSPPPSYSSHSSLNVVMPVRAITENHLTSVENPSLNTSDNLACSLKRLNVS